MASDSDKTSFNRLRLDGASNPSLIPKIPALPPDVRKRFPSLTQWEAKMEEWRIKAINGLGGHP